MAEDSPSSNDAAPEREQRPVPAPALPEVQWALLRQDEEEQNAPVVAPTISPRRPRRFEGSRRSIGWIRQSLALLGLALCVGCLAALLNGGPLPAWHPQWFRTVPAGPVAVVLDPGHGGGDSGAVAQGVVEKSLNLDVALRVGAQLRARGTTVVLTREDDRFVSLEDRVQMANALPGAVFVSIHFNDASGDGQAANRAGGIETYFTDHKLVPGSTWRWGAAWFGHKAQEVNAQTWAVRESALLADCIQNALIIHTAATDRGIKERSLYVTHRVLGPAVLVEGGFVSQPAEARLLGSTRYRQTLAEGIADGITKYLTGPHQRTPLVASTNAAGT